MFPRLWFLSKLSILKLYYCPVIILKSIGSPAVSTSITVSTLSYTFSPVFSETTKPINRSVFYRVSQIQNIIENYFVFFLISCHN